MRLVAIALVLLATCESSLSNTCGVADFLEQLLDSVKSIKGNGGGECDKAATKQFVQRKIDEGLQKAFTSTVVCYMGMGMKSRFIPDSAITASSTWGHQHESFQGRLDNQVVKGKSVGAWAVGPNKVGEWFQVDFGMVKQVAGVITQGRPSTTYPRWVRSYKVSCGTDLSNLSFVKENGQDKVFDGNNDMDTKVYNRFPKVMSCRYIRIYAQTWHNRIELRAEFVPGPCFDHPHPY